VHIAYPTLASTTAVTLLDTTTATSGQTGVLIGIGVETGCCRRGFV